MCLKNLNRPIEAIEILDKFIEMNPHNRDAFLCKGLK